MLNQNNFSNSKISASDFPPTFPKLCKIFNGSRPAIQPTSSDTLVKTFMRIVPDEILELILGFAVRGHRDMRTLSLTCKRWQNFAQQDTAWKRLSIRGWGNRSDIIQIPIDKDCGLSWYTYYKTRLLSHSPELSYLKSQQHMTVSIRYDSNQFETRVQFP